MKQLSTFDGARVLILAAVLVVVTACTNAAQKKWIDGANAAQQVAAETYNKAVAQQSAADIACAHAFTPSTPIPQTPDQKDGTCAALGKALPFKSTSLQKAAAPINATYDLVRKANAARVAATTAGGDPNIATDLLTQLAGLVVEVVGDLSDAGVPVPSGVTQFVDAFKAAGVN